MSTTYVSDQDRQFSTSLLSFIEQCPTAFHVQHKISARLERAGFRRLREDQAFDIRAGGAYYVVRNDSSVVAFRVGEEVEVPSFSIVIAHADSPTFRLKPVCEMEGPDDYLRLDVEAYGGTIDRSWLDRPLSVAGRVMVDESGRIERRLVYLDQDLLLIPSVAVHMNRDVNEKGAIDRVRDICPMASCGMMGKGAFDELVASAAGVETGQVLGRDLYLVNRTKGCIWGAASEFVSSPRLDDLMCAYASLVAFLGAHNPNHIAVFCCLDSEEVGSSTMQGALSTFVPDVLRRVTAALHPGAEDHLRALARSFVVSCDNAHAVHPNHPELADELCRPRINGGITIKYAARQTYATDGISAALMERICRDAGVPTQPFANRSDMRGGSTLGNLLLRGAGMHTVDIGLAQLAMHSAYETAGTKDAFWLATALAQFYSTRISLAPDGAICLA